MVDAATHNARAEQLARSYRESAATERRLASHQATASGRARLLRKARRYERLAAEAEATKVRP